MNKEDKKELEKTMIGAIKYSLKDIRSNIGEIRDKLRDLENSVDCHEILIEEGE